MPARRRHRVVIAGNVRISMPPFTRRLAVLVGAASLAACHAPSSEDREDDGWSSDPSNASWQDSTFHPAIDWEKYRAAGIGKKVTVAVGKHRIDLLRTPYTVAASNRWMRPLITADGYRCANVTAAERLSFDLKGRSIWLVKGTCDGSNSFSMQRRNPLSESDDLRRSSSWIISPWTDAVLSQMSPG
jgi:hypothetical protein